MIRRPPRSTLSSSSAASDVYKRQRPAQRIGPEIEFMGEFFLADERQHGPGIGIAWLHFHRAFQGGTRRGMLLSVDTLEVREAAQHRLVRAEIGWISCPEDVRHGAGQNALCVGNSGNDARNEIVLQLEESVRAESALVILGPKMGARDAIHKLDR